MEMTRANAGGMPVWAVDDVAVSGIGKDGFAFPLKDKSGARLAGLTVASLAELVKAGAVEMPRPSRGIAFRR